jgi:hypothetical protein
MEIRPQRKERSAVFESDGFRISFVVTVFLLKSCGLAKKDEPTNLLPSRKPNSVSIPTRNPVNASDKTHSIPTLSAVKSENETILPIGYFETNPLGVRKPCMGSYAGEGMFVTASHCLPKEFQEKCQEDFRLRWLKQDSSGQFVLSDSLTACEQAQFAPQSADGERPDVAKLKLAPKGTWPKFRVSFREEPFVKNQPVVVVGPVGLQNQLSFSLRQGFVFETRVIDFAYRATTLPGFSGTPILSPESVGSGKDLQALGLHLGMSSEVSVAVRGKIVLGLLGL